MLWVRLEIDSIQTTAAHWQALRSALQRMLPQLTTLGIECVHSGHRVDDVLRDLVAAGVAAPHLRHLQLRVSLSDSAILNAVRLCQGTIETLDVMENMSDVRNRGRRVFGNVQPPPQMPQLERLSFEIDVDMATVTSSALLDFVRPAVSDRLQRVCVVLRSGSAPLGVPLEALVVLLTQYFPRALLAANRLQRATLVLRGTPPYVLERAPWEGMKGAMAPAGDNAPTYRLVIDARANGSVAGVNRFPAYLWKSALDTVARRMSGGRARPEVWYTDPAGTEYRLEHGGQPMVLTASDRLECRFGS